MPSDDGPYGYRIERLDSGDVHLYRGAVLVDVDRGTDQDSCSDIERWDQSDLGEDGRTLIGIPYRYVSWRVEDEGITAWDELGSDNWATRHIEAELGQRYTAAASLADEATVRLVLAAASKNPGKRYRRRKIGPPTSAASGAATRPEPLRPTRSRKRNARNGVRTHVTPNRHPKIK